jgi:DNA-binding transcriptional LysR family regulator
LVQLDLNLLVVLDALLEEGSVGGAADRLHLSSPAVSRALGRIRRATRDQILVRTGRTMTPTPYALRVRAQVHALVAQAEAVLAPDPELDLANLERTFTIQCHDAIATAVGPRLVETVQTHAPQVTLRILAEGSSDTADLRRGQIDLEIGADAPTATDVRSEQIGEDRLVAVMRHDHPCARHRLTARRWAQADHVTISRRGRLRDLVDDLLEEQGLTRRVVASAPTTTAALAMVASNQLVTLVPRHMSRTMLTALDLDSAEPPLELPPSPVIVAWHQRYDNDRAHTWLRHTITAVLQQAAGVSCIVPGS